MRHRRTLSVDEVATILGVTPKTVLYRLQTGRLKGFQEYNGRGAREWRIYVTRPVLLAIGQDQRRFISDLPSPPNLDDTPFEHDEETLFIGPVETELEDSEVPPISVQCSHLFNEDADRIICSLSSAIARQETVIGDQLQQIGVLAEKADLVPALESRIAGLEEHNKFLTTRLIESQDARSRLSKQFQHQIRELANEIQTLTCRLADMEEQSRKTSELANLSARIDCIAEDLPLLRQQMESMFLDRSLVGAGKGGDL